MFTLLNPEEITFSWPVEVRYPVDGNHEVRCFTAIFKLLPDDRFDAIVEEAAGRGADGGLMQEALIGWGDDLVDEEKKPVPFSAAARDALIRVPFIRAALVRAYMAAASGRAAEKN